MNKDESYKQEYRPFLDFLEFEKRYSVRTIFSYEKDLHDFLRYLDDTYQIVSPRQVDTTMIRSWMVSLKEGQLSARSINRKLSALRSWFKFLSRTKAISQNPVLPVQGLKADKRLPVFVERKAMDT